MGDGNNTVVITFQFQTEGQSGVLSAVDAINEKIKQGQEARQAAFSIANVAPGGASVPWQPPSAGIDTLTGLPIASLEERRNTPSSIHLPEPAPEDKHVNVHAHASGHEEIAELGKGAEVANKSFEVLKRGIEGVGQALISGSLQTSITAFTRFSSAVGEADSVIGGFTSKFGLVGAVGTAVAAALTTAVTVGNELAQRMSENVLEFNELAKAAGLTGQQFANLEGAFRRSGVGLEQLHQVVRVTTNRLQGEWGDIVRTVRDSADHYAEGAIKIGESQRKLVDSADLPVEAEMKIAKSRREEIDSADKTVEADVKIAKSRRDVADSTDLTSQAEMKVAKAQRDEIDSTNLPHQAQRKIEGAELNARSAEDAVPGAERTKQQTEFDLAKAQLQFRAKYLGEPITPEDTQRLQLMQRQADASHIEALQAQEKEDARNIERAKMHREEAEETEQKTHRNAVPEALEGQERVREEAGRAERNAIPEALEAQQQARLDAARIARDAIPEAREAQEQARIDRAKAERDAMPEAEDAKSRAAIELRANQRAQSDAMQKDPARLAEAIRAGGGGVNWREIAAPDIFRSLAFMGGGTMMGTLSAAHQFVTMPAMQGQTETNQGVAGAVAQQFGMRGNIAAVLDTITKGEFNKTTPETEKTAATMGEEGAQKSAEAVRNSWAEASETTRNAVVQAGQQFSALSVTTAKGMADTIQHMADGVSGVTKLGDAATRAADALNNLAGIHIGPDGKAVQEGGSLGNLGAAIAGAIHDSTVAFIKGGLPSGAGHATGGLITGPGTGTSDSIRAPWVSNGEYIIKAARVAEVGVDKLDALNQGKIGFADGGFVNDDHGTGPEDALSPRALAVATMRGPGREEWDSQGWSKGTLDDYNNAVTGPRMYGGESRTVDAIDDSPPPGGNREDEFKYKLRTLRLNRQEDHLADGGLVDMPVLTDDGQPWPAPGGATSPPPPTPSGYWLPKILGGIWNSLKSGATLPGDVATGKAHTTDANFASRVVDMTGLVTGGSGLGEAPEGALRAGAARAAEEKGTENPFHEWFGDSKVVDKEGKPLVVYHGTNADFSEFDPSRSKDIGIHFGSAKQADTALKPLGHYDEGAHIMPSYLSIENPLRVKDVFSVLGKRLQSVAKTLTLDTPDLHFEDESRQRLYEVARQADKIRAKAGGDFSLGLLDRNKAASVKHEELAREFWQVAQRQIEKRGFDGLVYANKVEGKGDSFVAFHPGQIRSSTAQPPESGVFVRAAEKGIAKEAEKGIVAYHGSPHDFDKFSSAHIGEGEGAQAYGHGLYFAESEGVAKSYRDQLSAAQMAIDGQPFEPGNYGITRMVADNKGDLPALEKNLRQYAEEGKSNPYSNHADATKIADAIQQGKFSVGSPGHMYQVRIGAEPEHFLDWDKPLSEQHPKVRGSLANVPGVIPSSSDAAVLHYGYDSAEFAALPADRKEQLISKMPPSVLEDLMRSKSGADIGRGIDAATLHEAGIPGIRYLDQGSRNSSAAKLEQYENDIKRLERVRAVKPHEFDERAYNLAKENADYVRKSLEAQSRNYVVFDDKLVNIEKKYALGGRVGYAEGGLVTDGVEPPDGWVTGRLGVMGDPGVAGDPGVVGETAEEAADSTAFVAHAHEMSERAKTTGRQSGNYYAHWDRSAKKWVYDTHAWLTPEENKRYHADPEKFDFSTTMHEIVSKRASDVITAEHEASATRNVAERNEIFANLDKERSSDHDYSIQRQDRHAGLFGEKTAPTGFDLPPAILPEHPHSTGRLLPSTQLRPGQVPAISAGSFESRYRYGSDKDLERRFVYWDKDQNIAVLRNPLGDTRPAIHVAQPEDHRDEVETGPPDAGWGRRSLETSFDSLPARSSEESRTALDRAYESIAHEVSRPTGAHHHHDRDDSTGFASGGLWLSRHHEADDYYDEIHDPRGGLRSQWGTGPSGFSTGGFVSGPGTGTSDSIRAPWLSNGEYVIRADTVAQVGVPRLDALNEGRVGFAEGGVVSLPSAYNGAQIMGQAAAGLSSMMLTPFGAPPPATGGFMISAVNQLNSERSAFHSGMMLGNNSLSASGLVGASATAPVLSGGHYALDVTSDHGTFSVMANEDMMSSLSQSALASKLTRTGITPSWGS